MSLYNEMKFQIMDSPVPPRNRFDDLADALRSLPEGKAIRVEYDEEIARASQRINIKQAMNNRGLKIWQKLESDGIYITVDVDILKEATVRQSLSKGVCRDASGILAQRTTLSGKDGEGEKMGNKIHLRLFLHGNISDGQIFVWTQIEDDFGITYLGPGEDNIRRCACGCGLNARRGPYIKAHNPNNMEAMQWMKARREHRNVKKWLASPNRFQSQTTASRMAPTSQTS